MNTETQNESTNDINIEEPVKRGRGRPAKPKEPTPPTPPKPPKPIKHSLYLDDYKEWFRQYYKNKLLNPCECPTCGTKYTSTYSLRRHAGRSNKCRVIALENIISELTDLKKDI